MHFTLRAGAPQIDTFLTKLHSTEPVTVDGRAVGDWTLVRAAMGRKHGHVRFWLKRNKENVK